MKDDPYVDLTENVNGTLTEDLSDIEHIIADYDGLEDGQEEIA